MNKKAFTLALLAASTLPAHADNFAATPGTGITFAAKSIGGVLYPWVLNANGTGTEIFTSANPGVVSFPSAQPVTNATASLFLATVSNATASLFNATVANATASLFNATVSNATGSLLNATITGSVTVGNATVLGQATSTGSSPVVLSSNQAVGDPCMFQPKINAAISSSLGSIAAVAGVSAKKVYICSLALISNNTANVSVIEGSTTTCSAGGVAIIGSVTAASGMALAPNGGLTLGSGAGTVAQSGGAANSVCVLQNTTALIAGNISYVQQ